MKRKTSDDLKKLTKAQKLLAEAASLLKEAGEPVKSMRCADVASSITHTTRLEEVMTCYA